MSQLLLVLSNEGSPKMKKLWLTLGLLLSLTPAQAQPFTMPPPAGIEVTAPYGKTTVLTKVTIAVTNTYQQALAANSLRLGCTIQYIAVAGTVGYVYFGSDPSDNTTSFQLVNGQTISCATATGGVLSDRVTVTGTGTDIFVVGTQ